MLHSLHHDVAFYVPGNTWHPGEHKDRFLFTALTTRGREQLQSAPWGDFSDGHLSVSCETEATDVMDHIETLEVYMSH